MWNVGVCAQRESKRLSLSKKYKVQKKIREHVKKQRKSDHALSGRKSTKKDPGIPNLFPYKEQILRQVAEKKKSILEENLRRKLESRRVKSLGEMRADAERRGIDHDMVTDDASFSVRHERSGKDYFSEFRKVTSEADVIIEVSYHHILHWKCPMECTHIGRMTLCTHNLHCISFLIRYAFFPE
jgi:nuclear GTP-binding protein